MLKNINLKHLLTLALIAGLATMFNACDDDDEKGSSEVVLTSFGPSGVHHGEKIKFIGQNLDEVTAIVLFPNVEVPSSAFVSQSGTLIELIVPDATETGKVILKTPNGDIESKTIFSLEVPVTISSVTAEAKPGTNITITGEYVNWIKEVWFTEDVVADSNQFVSKSVNELVVTVPMEAQTGPLVFITGGTEPEEIDSEEDLIVILPTIDSFTPTQAERGDDITITGTDLDLVAGILFKGSDNPVTGFVSRTETQIVVTIPNYANKGKISLVTFSGILLESSTILSIPLPPIEPLDFVIYDDVLKNGWQKWGGWGSGSSDINNSDNVREGDKGIKVVFGGGWGGSLQFGGASSSTTGFTKFAISIFGNAGTGGKVMNLIVKGGTTEEKQITIVEGEWTDYEFPLSTTFGDPATITEMIFQDRDWSGTIYVDAIGLR